MSDFSNFRMSIVLIGMTSAAVLVLARQSLTERRTNSDDDDDVSHSNDDSNPTTNSYSRMDNRKKPSNHQMFPWEPKGLRIDDDTSPCKVVENETVSISNVRLGENEQRKQLDFLATMTFTNGGLRAPSCPCCQ